MSFAKFAMILLAHWTATQRTFLTIKKQCKQLKEYANSRAARGALSKRKNYNFIAKGYNSEAFDKTQHVTEQGSTGKR